MAPRPASGAVSVLGSHRVDEDVMAKKDNEKGEVEGAVAENADGPLLDLSDAAVKRMIKAAKKRGFVTYAELNAVLPSEEVNSEQIEDILAMLNEMGINVVEAEESRRATKAEEKEEEAEEADGRRSGRSLAGQRPWSVRSSEPADRTDDPVRMYLREMGSVELLSREGEIAIAKRIEAGREAMIAGSVREPADVPGHHHLARRAQRFEGCCCATSSIWRRPTPVPTARTHPRST